MMDCLQQQSQPEVRELLTAPQLTMPGEMIRFILGEQKTASVTKEGFAAAAVAAVGARVLCCRCGQAGCIKVRYGHPQQVCW